MGNQVKLPLFLSSSGPNPQLEQTCWCFKLWFIYDSWIQPPTHAKYCFTWVKVTEHGLKYIQNAHTGWTPTLLETYARWATPSVWLLLPAKFSHHHLTSSSIRRQKHVSNAAHVWGGWSPGQQREQAPLLPPSQFCGKWCAGSLLLHSDSHLPVGRENSPWPTVMSEFADPCMYTRIPLKMSLHNCSNSAGKTVSINREKANKKQKTQH